LHDYTGLPVEYIKKADLRINGGEFEKTLQDDSDTTTGRWDTRFAGPTMDPLSKAADYDPQTAAIGSAYVSAFNEYVRKALKYGDDKMYKSMIFLGGTWNYQHQPPNFFRPLRQANVMSDLAWAMKYNNEPEDPAERRLFRFGDAILRGHLRDAAIADADQPSGQHRVQVLSVRPHGLCSRARLKELHDNVAAFIRGTDHLPAD
jgi:hypothetical protein